MPDEAHLDENREPLRRAMAAIERDPHLARSLGADLMEARRRDQADRGVRHGRGVQREPVVLGDRRVRLAVPAPRDTMQSARPDQTAEGLRMDPSGYHLPPCDRAPSVRQKEDAPFVQRYTFTASNDEVDFLAQQTGFSVFFDPALYANLQDLGSASTTSWSVLMLQPDTALPADGLFDALALIDFPPFTTAGTAFDVAVDWLGSDGSPGSQPWEIYDFDPVARLTVLQSGTTASVVPEPGSAVLLGFGLLILLAVRRVARSRARLAGLALAGFLAPNGG